jgi:hypothetical protein
MKSHSVLAKRVRVVVGLAAVAGLLAVAPARTARGADEVDPEVKKLIARLSDTSASPASRVTIAKKLATFDPEKGKPAARALCGAATNTGALRTAALDALQKLHPKLYPEVTTIVSDNNPKNHYMAQGAIAKMGDDGNAAMPVILAHLKLHSKIGQAAFQVREEYLEIEPKESIPVPILRKIAGLQGNALENELRVLKWLTPAEVSAALASVDFLVISRIAPKETNAVKFIAENLDHKNSLIRFTSLIALDQCDVAITSAHQKVVKKHKLDAIKPIRELAVDLDKKLDTYLTTKELKKEDKKP